MPFAANGTYTPPTGAQNAAPGVVIRSTTWNTIFTDISAALTTLGQASPAVAGAGAKFSQPSFILTAQSVSFATGTLDAATLAVTLPGTISNWLLSNVRIANPSASLANASWGLFTGPGGTGITLFSVNNTISITTSAINSINNAMNTVFANGAIQAFNSGTLYFRVGTASPGTADVMVQVFPVY